MSHQIHTYSELRQQIHDDLRMQHPEWVQSNGESPKCDSYESRLAKLLENFTRTGTDESIAGVHRILEPDIKLNRHRTCWINQTCAASGQQSIKAANP